MKRWRELVCAIRCGGYARGVTVPGNEAAPAKGKVRLKGLAGALLRFQVMAFITGVLLAVMTVIGLPYKYLLDGSAEWYSVGWIAHGWLYIAYVIVSLDLVFRMKWHLGRALLIVLAGTVPFMSFVAERWVTRRVKPLLEASDPEK